MANCRFTGVRQPTGTQMSRAEIFFNPVLHDEPSLVLRIEADAASTSLSPHNQATQLDLCRRCEHKPQLANLFHRERVITLDRNAARAHIEGLSVYAAIRQGKPDFG